MKVRWLCTIGDCDGAPARISCQRMPLSKQAHLREFVDVEPQRCDLVLERMPVGGEECEVRFIPEVQCKRTKPDRHSIEQ